MAAVRKGNLYISLSTPPQEGLISLGISGIYVSQNTPLFPKEFPETYIQPKVQIADTPPPSALPVGSASLASPSAPAPRL